MDGQYDKFTERARRVMDLAREEARALDHHYIGTEHLLIGLARERDGLGAKILANLGQDEATIREVVAAALGPGTGKQAGEAELVPRARKAIELAFDEARRFRHHYIGTEHLLIGLMRVEDGIAAGILVGLGVTLDQVRDQVEALVGGDQRGAVREAVERAIGRVRGRRAAGDGAETKGNVITCRITDQDLAAIDALVESGIRTTRSDAAAWLIGAGIEARRDVFDKVFATIDQIRQLRAEAQAIARQAGGGGGEG